MLRANFSQGFFFSGDPQSIFKDCTEAKPCSAPHADFGLRWETPGQWGWGGGLPEGEGGQKRLKEGWQKLILGIGRELHSQAGKPMKTHHAPPSRHLGLWGQGSLKSVIPVAAMTLLQT